MNKFRTAVVLAVSLALSASFAFMPASAAPDAYIDETLEDAVGGTDEKKTFEGTSLWWGNELDLKEYANAGTMGISSASDSKTKAYVIDGKKSVFAINYKNSAAMTGDPAKEWCNLWATHDTLKGLSNNKVYAISFLLRCYTDWEPEATKGQALQNFAIVSIRNVADRDNSLIDYYVQPNILSDGVSEDQMIRVDDKSSPANSKNVMSVKKLNDNTFSVVCKFVTSKPAKAEGDNRWYASFTFHGPGVIACDNIKVVQSDRPVAAFHQTLPSGSGDPTPPPTQGNESSDPESTQPTESSSETQPTSAPTQDTSESSESSVPVKTTGKSAASTTNPAQAGTNSAGESGGPNVGLIVGIIAAIVVVLAGIGAACYFLIVKKKRIPPVDGGNV